MPLWTKIIEMKKEQVIAGSIALFSAGMAMGPLVVKVAKKVGSLIKVKMMSDEEKEHDEYIR